jgi:3-oxoacyl-[acyl-carrier protein] reductase
MDLGLAGKRVLVTGASGKIGRATAKAFGAEGALVAVGYHRNEADAVQIVAAVEAAGARAMAVPVDLETPDAAGRPVGQVLDTWGGLDVLVNSAIAWPPRGEPGETFESVPLQRVRDATEANLLGTYTLTQAAVAAMRPGGWGRITHLSTGLVEDGFPGSSPYTTPKAALHGLTRTMSRELAAAGIYTNLVMAGFVPAEDVPPAILEQASLAAATNRPSLAEEVANVVVFLSSAANGHVTGEMIRVDGHFLTRT